VNEIQADMGIGLCLGCVLLHKQAIAARTANPKQPVPAPPQFAITWQPTQFGQMTPQGPAVVILAAPLCYEHTIAPGPAGPPRKPLLVAGAMT
jgi:hypothetical protein